MKQYLDLLNTIIKKGEKQEDRTGVGTISYFGHQMRFDLNKGFPLTTTKKTFFKGIVAELLWFLEGSTDERRLAEIQYEDDRENLKNKSTFWKDNADNQGKALGYENNETIKLLGPVYGTNWREFGYSHKYIKPVKKIKEKSSYPLNKELLYFEEDPKIKELWIKIKKECCDKWKDYKQFQSDFKNLDGYRKFKRGEPVTLFKHYYGENKTYNPETTILAPLNEINYEEEQYQYQIEDKVIFFLSKKDAEEYFKKPFNKIIKIKGFEIYKNENYVLRYSNPVDQIKEVINEIKKNPSSRRLLVSAWNPLTVDHVALPSCHTFFQFNVSNGKLNCQMYQRSADSFLGVPFNIASYALLTMIIAKQCNLEYGEFIHTIGDAHIYSNHLEQVKTQLKRTPFKLPTLKIKEVDSIDDYKMSDFELVDYICHEKITAPMAV